MVFSSTPFLFGFLPAFLAVYYLTPSRFRNGVALAASLLFYAWGAPKVVVYLALSCALDYGAGRLIARLDARPRRAVAAAAILFNVGLLVYFKYANFFVHEMSWIVQGVGGLPLKWTEVALPIGISFFTFHRVSYIVDVYRKTTAPATSYANYLLYVLLFPQLIAGPIVRYHEVAGDIAARPHTVESVFNGLYRFVLGLAKKVLLANVLGEVADKVFDIPAASVPTSYAWFGILCYTFQIYFDFSGYSDMAIGLAMMIGIRFPENFRDPYVSRSVTEFWRRWHISLSSFMRDYVYIPLGGNRGGPLRGYVNLWAVFLLSGLWHGASWNFVAWGAFHGLFLTLDKLFWTRTSERLPKAAALAITFFVVILGWVLFRSPDLAFAVRYAARMFGLVPWVEPAVPVPWPALAGPRAFFTLALAAGVCFVPAFDGLKAAARRVTASWSEARLDTLRFACALALAVLSLSYLSASAFNPFIYFRF